MLSPLFLRKSVFLWLFAVAIPGLLSGQTGYNPHGSEYSIAGSIPGDQVYPQIAVRPGGGILVWQDNNTDGDGLGISARQLDSSYSGTLASFAVNSEAKGDQENAQVTLLKDGGAAIVWQGGAQGFQHIYARIRSSANTWLGGDLLVSGSSTAYQINPAIAALSGGGLVVAYSSINQAAPNSLQDVYYQLLSPAGEKVGAELRANQFSTFNQRDPSVAALSDGRFVVAWVSEQQRVTEAYGTMSTQTHDTASVDIYARIFSASGNPVGSEFLVNTSSNLCSRPRVAAGANGSFAVAWSERDLTLKANGWDTMVRSFTSAGVGRLARCAHAVRLGDQLLPAITSDASGYLLTWTSLGQDGSMEGIFGSFLTPEGLSDGGEFRANTTWLGTQTHPAVSADGDGRFVAVWTSFGGGLSSFDLAAQRYERSGQPLSAMDAPMVFVPFEVVSNKYQPQIVVTWPLQTGLDVDKYSVFLDGASSPVATVTGNRWVMTAADGLTAGTTHSFQVEYITSTGKHSPRSAAASATTWAGFSWGGIPFEWMSQYYGVGEMLNWPTPAAVLEPNGPTLLQVFLSGDNPLDPASWLRIKLAETSQGLRLGWNTRPGLIYQVQISSDLESWSDLGSPRLASGTSDFILTSGNNSIYYRVLRLR